MNYSEDKKPSFRSDRYQFTVVIPNLNYGIDEQNIDSVNDVKEKVGTNDAKIGVNSEKQKNKMIRKMIENPKITQNELAITLGVSKRTVQRTIEELVKENKVIRVGSKRVGYWEVLK